MKRRGSRTPWEDERLARRRPSQRRLLASVSYRPRSSRGTENRSARRRRPRPAPARLDVVRGCTRNHTRAGRDVTAWSATSASLQQDHTIAFPRSAHATSSHQEVKAMLFLPHPDWPLVSASIGLEIMFSPSLLGFIAKHTHTLYWHVGFELPSNRMVKVIIQATCVCVCVWTGSCNNSVCVCVCI